MWPKVAIVPRLKIQKPGKVAIRFVLQRPWILRLCQKQKCKKIYLPYTLTKIWQQLQLNLRQLQLNLLQKLLKGLSIFSTFWWASASLFWSWLWLLLWQYSAHANVRHCWNIVNKRGRRMRTVRLTIFNVCRLFPLSLTFRHHHKKVKIPPRKPFPKA